MKSIAGLKLPVMAIVGAMALVGCNAADEADTQASTSTTTVATTTAAAETTTATKAATHKASLADWDGKYASLASFLDDPDFDEEFAAAAKEHGVDLVETKAKLKERYGIPFEGLIVDGDTVTFVKDSANLDNPSEAPIKYTFDEGFEQDYNGHDLKWSIFEAQGDSEFKYVFLMPIHGEESLLHFHARFGNDKDELKKSEKFPTFVDPKIATKEQIVEELMEHAH